MTGICSADRPRLAALPPRLRAALGSPRRLFGVADATYGEELCAWVRLREGESMTAEEVRDFCRGRIAHYKVPRHVRFVEAFPMTVTGKMQKYLMRQQMEQELRGEMAG
jgi:fatty-acyl-CoA synthase